MERSAWGERLRQFRGALHPRFSATDEQFVFTSLSEPAKRLFDRQSLYERQHAIRHVRRLFVRDPHIHGDLVTAAFLHDIGKSTAPIAVWHRVLYVLAGPLLTARLRLSEPTRTAPLHPLWVLHHHATLGAAMIRAAGLPERVTWLVEHHHDRDPLDADLQLLQRVDTGQL